MSADGDPTTQNFRVEIKNGELDMLVKFVDFHGSLRPFIKRTVWLSFSQQRTKTEQHTLIKSSSELDSWIGQDEFSLLFPEAFSQLKLFCASVVK